MKTIPNLASVVWRKSSYSDGGEDNCVEVSDGFPGAVPVRDSKNPTGVCCSSRPRPGRPS